MGLFDVMFEVGDVCSVVFMMLRGSGTICRSADHSLGSGSSIMDATRLT